MESTAFASSASSLSKTGSPRPAGTFRTVHCTIAPAESPACLIEASLLCISEGSSSVAEIGLQGMPAISIAEVSIVIGRIAPCCRRFSPSADVPSNGLPSALHAVYCAEYSGEQCVNTFFAITPAAIRAAASRPDARPPPRQSRRRYFAS